MMMKNVCDENMKSLLQDIKLHMIDEKEYDIEARELCHRIDRLMAGKGPQRTPVEIKVSLDKTLN